jgi:hypothetical protein
VADWTLHLGDCLDVLPGLDVSGTALVLTDPPYGITYRNNHRVGQGSTPITNDGTRLSLWLYRKVIPLLKGARHVLWFTRWDAWPDVWGVVGQAFPIKGLLVWDKGHNGMGDLNHWGCSHEFIASCGWGQASGGRDGSILRFAPVPAIHRLHPAEKPVALLSYLIGKMTNPGDTVLDPFAGSAAVGVACRQTGRRFVGIEIDPDFHAVARKRLEEAHGPLFAAPPAQGLLPSRAD